VLEELLLKGKTTRDFVSIMKNMLKLAFMDAGSCVRNGVMNFRTGCQTVHVFLKELFLSLFFA